MGRLLKIVLILEVVLGLCLSVAVLTASRENWGIIYLLFLYACSQLPLVLLGLWALLFRSQLRATAAWVSALPFVFLFLPLLLRTAMGEPISSRVLLAAALTAALGLSVLAFARPQAVAARLPTALLQSKTQNVVLLALLGAGWCVAIALFLKTGPALLDTSSGQGSPGMGGAMLLIISLGWLAGLACLSLFVAAWGWVGLRGTTRSAQTKLHIAQLVLASPGLLIGIAALWSVAT
tara:strand:- start:705 stop:1412 length:708 start_codon:yes stop_codon:yes gene_type:complete